MPDYAACVAATCAGCCPRLTQHPDWVLPDINEICCDDDPKHQQEPSITAAWWNPDVGLAVFMDRSCSGPPPAIGEPADGFAVSIDGGQSWNRLDRDNDFRPDPCQASLSFVPGFARTDQDICQEQFTFHGSADPGTATGFDNTPGQEIGYLYFTCSAPYFARLKMDPATGAPLAGWQAVNVPGFDAVGLPADKPYVSANPEGEEVYVHWTARAVTGTGPYEIFLTASCNYGDNFFFSGAQCPHTIEAVQLSYLTPEFLEQLPPNWGTASAVGPAPAPTPEDPDPRGDVYFIWPERNVQTGIDQIYLRMLHWDAGSPAFEPPLDELPGCDPGVPCCDRSDPCQYDPVDPVGRLCACEIPIIHDQPGIGGDGYDGTWKGRVRQSLNIQTLTHPTVAVDRTNPNDPCGFGGNIYVAYAAEEPNKIYDPPDQDYVFVDSNIYIVHSRDGGLTWSEPLRIEDDIPHLEEAYETRCPGIISPCPGGVSSFRRPIQFYPWIAVDKQGRIGVMWHDTWPDYLGTHPNANPCDGNVLYNVHFAYSLDGGVTWSYQWEINDEVSQTGVGLTWDECGIDITLGEYSGLSATSTADSGHGIFHAIWTDFREYRTPWRQRDEDPDGPIWPGAMGDIYTTKVVVEGHVHSMGDFDRDYDVDMDDFGGFNTCSVVPLPAPCEILDMNRNNEIDNTDPALFMVDCLTGPLGGGDGATTEGSAEAELGGSDSLDAMVDWCVERMSAEERSELADSIRDAAQRVDDSEAVRMNTFANAIDPVE